MNEKQRGRGIYLLPNLFTTAALFSGFFAILAAVDGHFEKAAIAIFVAMLLDALDGRVARLTHTQTDFGGEYDSLSDMVAFGLAPGLVMYLWALQSLGKLGWFAAFVYVAGAALRLARFNTQIVTADKRYFTGLPSPSAAAIVAGAVWVSVDYNLDPVLLSIPAGILTLLAGLAMISNLRYNSFKEIDVRRRVPFIVLVIIALVISVIITDPPLVLFGAFLVYAISGVILSFRKPASTDDDASTNDEEDASN
ncbi:MAG: CDP-diacylglycerol--serine O-phosphatidyltransferase [Gammaproteobacteria bacterium]|jgi:CDP-diacylglycerol---serine O-phosphatidyltransferase